MNEKRKIPRIMDLRGTYKGGGGPDKTVLNSAALHDPEKVHVLVTYLRAPWDDQFQIPEMAARLKINYVDVLDRSFLDLECLRRLAALVKEHRLNVVHSHDDKTLLYAWLLKLLIPAVRIVHTCHSHAVGERHCFPCLSSFLRFKGRQRMQIFLMRRHLQPVLAVSADTGRRLVASGLPEEGVTVLHNGIDTSRWCRDDALPVLRRELSLREGRLLVGTVARITPEKDLPTFYDVAALVARKLPGTLFAVVGDGYGDELAVARREVARRGLEKTVHFTGHRNDLPDLYASFDVFLMTSVTEGMPNTLLEAMSMAVPSVATAVGGVPELLQHGRGGFLASAGDAEALARHVLTLLESPELRKEFGAACRARIEERFAFDRRVRLMEEYYAWFAGCGSLPDPVPAWSGFADES
ncbi:glycosyltransferase family 4 protein [Geomonas sp. RF6]|uniref:glycosyltransferase family 4 protein n=1 Tax=Geomonas sp. RF6 TaxID=2897342 RepID=UPI001E541BC6|nr:glycosyltransferase family 4 protein [Geomonas sp. RF6]UFS69127.1 glycosyltransferase family 4 protein [Geomonas sp. RF6]